MGYKVRSDKEPEIAARFSSGESAVSIAKTFGVRSETIRLILNRLGVPLTQQGRRLSAEQEFEIVQLYAGGLNSHQIAQRLGVGASVCIKAIRRNGVEPRASVKRHKLSAEQKAELVRLYVEERETYEELCKRYSISTTVVRSVLKDASVTPRTGGRYREVVWTDRKGRKIIFKSSWERGYARHLDTMGLDWEYEPIKLGLKVCRVYTPDFGICGADGQFVRFVEVKGWLDDRSINRLAEARLRYPSLILEIVGPAQLAALGIVESKYANHPMAHRVNEAAIPWA